MTAASTTARRLDRLARWHGVQRSYVAHDGRRVTASRDTVRALLAALGHPVWTAADVDAEYAAAARTQRERVLEPVTVLGGDGRLTTPITLPAAADLSTARLSIRHEDGAVVERPLADVTGRTRGTLDGDHVERTVDLRSVTPPPGYHRLDVGVDGDLTASALLLAPPPPPSRSPRGFGALAPLYALRSDADWGVGSFTQLAEFTDLVGRWGGELAGTLPLFAAFLDEPVDPSPYRPVSRRFWNELFVDVERLPELAVSPAARDLVASATLRRELDRLRRTPAVDYAAVAAVKRRVMEHCAAALAAEPSDRRDEFRQYVKAHPDLDRYADFRAAGEATGMRWRSWTAAPGELPAADLATAALYHRYAQFVAAEQLAAAAGGAPAAGLYLDLPVGVHPDGYDTWAEAELFAPADVGAPPDAFFSGGQSWGFPPLHPQRLRETGYRYLAEAYRHAFHHSTAVRIDHVLGLQRLFWIPPGSGAEHGAYVRYPHRELRAVIALEAARAGVVVIGEDLGTVSPEILRAMDQDGMLHSFVHRFEATPTTPFPQPRRPSAASLGSHDLPRFAAWWRGEDVEERVSTAGLGAAAAQRERRDRQALVTAVLDRTAVSDAQRQALTGEPAGDAAVRAGLHACLAALAGGPAAYVLADLADLELDDVPDNRPGSGPEAGNWRHRLSRPLDVIAQDPEVAGLVTTIRNGRSRAGAEGEGR